MILSFFFSFSLSIYQAKHVRENRRAWREGTADVLGVCAGFGASSYFVHTERHVAVFDLHFTCMKVVLGHFTSRIKVV